MSITSRLPVAGFSHLVPGKRYEVVEAFTDWRQVVHPVGETWTYLTHNFVPYDDGLSLYVTADGIEERQIMLHWTAEDQGPIADHLHRYVRAVSS